jgi:hypothetical protein
MATPIDPNTCEQVSPDTWSQFPAKDIVSAACYDVIDASALSFCKSGVSIAADTSSGSVIISGQTVFDTPPQTAMAPSDPNDLVNKTYADSRFPEWASGPAQQPVDLSCNKLTNVGEIIFCDGVGSINSGSPSIVESTQTLVLSTTGPSITLNGAFNTVQLTTPTIPVIPTPAPTTFASDQLIPRYYVDMILPYFTPHVGGYLPGACHNIRKNVPKVSVATLSTTGIGELFYFYPYLDIPVTHVTVYNITASTTIQFGFALIAYNNITDATGTCVASTANASLPSGLSAFLTVANSRIAIPLFQSSSAIDPVPYTLLAGKKYAVALYKNSTTTFSMLGYNSIATTTGGTILVDAPAFGGGLDVSGGSIVELQAAGIFNTTGTPYANTIPKVGDIVTQSNGRVSVVNLGLQSAIS